MAQDNWHAMPVGKGKFHASKSESTQHAKQTTRKPRSRKADLEITAIPLRQEKTVKEILDTIYPQSTSKEAPQKSELKNRRFALGRFAGETESSLPSSPAKLEPWQGNVHIAKPKATIIMKDGVERVDPHAIMLRFRHLLLDKFSTIQAAFEGFEQELPPGAAFDGASRNDWRMFSDGGGLGLQGL